MNSQLDLEQVVTDWLQTEASASGSDRVLAAALVRASTVGQQRRRPTWMHLPLGPTLKVAMVVVGAVVIAIASFGLLLGTRDVGPGFIVGSSPAPSSTPPPCPRPNEPMASGPHVITEFAPIALTITLPDAWVARCFKATTAAGEDPVWWAGAGRALGEIGFTTADPIPAECQGLPGWDRSDITISGFEGERFDYVGPFAPPFTDCHPNLLMDRLGEGGGRGPQTLFTLWALDVDGERLSMYAVIKALDYQRKEELGRLVESVEIEARPSPSPSATPTAAVYPPGFNIPPGDRQSLTVDGVPFSFSVPIEGWMPGIQQKEPDGTFRPRSLYVGKSIVLGQAAEAVVFWTAFPDGVNTDPCANLLSPQVGSSVADLATAVATAPGTDLVTGPLNAILGGREAKHVVLTVRERLGCDPGFFFSWPDECWGDCWVATDVGDMIRVWVVDVDGTRLVIEAETKSRPDDPLLEPEVQQLLQSELDQEVQQIVESIRFE